jgi:hypothetical protein
VSGRRAKLAMLPGSSGFILLCSCIPLTNLAQLSSPQRSTRTIVMELKL